MEIMKMQIPQCDTVIPGKISCFINTQAAFPNWYTLLKLKQRGYCLASFLGSTPVAPCQLFVHFTTENWKRTRLGTIYVRVATCHLYVCCSMKSLWMRQFSWESDNDIVCNNWSQQTWLAQTDWYLLEFSSPSPTLVRLMKAGSKKYSVRTRKM